MTRYVLDTNIVSLILRQQPPVSTRFRKFAVPENQFLTCPMVWYEVYRGLIARDAKLQMQHFAELFAEFIWQDFTREDWSQASTLWAKRRAMGLPISDADLVIAVFAINRSAILVTNNEKDFKELGVNVENWLSNDT